MTAPVAPKAAAVRKDRADITWVLHTRENYEQRGAGRHGSAEQIVERGGARLDQSSDALRMLGVGEAFEEAIGGAQGGEGDFRSADETERVVRGGVRRIR